MGDVVDLRGAYRHLTGTAYCTECNHEWVAVREVGTTNMEFPNCHGMFGVPKSECVPDTFWECQCGNHLHYLTPEGAMCRMCGMIATGWAE